MLATRNKLSGSQQSRLFQKQLHLSCIKTIVKIILVKNYRKIRMRRGRIRHGDNGNGHAHAYSKSNGQSQEDKKNLHMSGAKFLSWFDEINPWQLQKRRGLVRHCRFASTDARSLRKT